MLFFRIVALLTFPGVIVHEFSHKFFCDWAGVKVFEVCYFRFGDPAGFVVHAAAKKFSQSFFISIGPFVIGAFFSVLLFLLFKVHTTEIRGIVFAWLGLSIAANCFPSKGDAKVLWSETKRHIWRSPLALIGLPAAAVIWLINELNFFYFNYIFAIAMFWLVAFHLK